VRSKEIVGQQAAKGVELVVITSPSQAPAGELDNQRSEVIDGVRYFRSCGKLLSPHKEVYDPSPLRSSLRILQNAALLRMALNVGRAFSPDLIHAHSPFTCGIVGDISGRILGVPTVYEMRGIWEDSHTSRYGLSRTSLRYRGVRRLENIALRGTDHCVVISEALRDEVVDRGVQRDRITIVPNGVDCEYFRPGDPNSDLAMRIGTVDSVVFGYVGYFFQYEGLDLLFEAFSVLAREFPKLKLLLVGDGELMPVLKRMTQEQGLGDRVVFTGRVSHDEVLEYYRLFDFLVLPRRLGRESTLVTPLKPLEIMAMAKPLVASNVGGHLEIVQDAVNGLIFESDEVESLVEKCRLLVMQESLRRELGAKARKWVEDHRDWNVLIDLYMALYGKVIRIRDGRP
jgi:PEP-CTERM/exosortase A-associated glycosyltransferase